ncbi:MAG: hypothetical protein ACRD2L_25705 [Terriglobia bacterium]
MATRKKSKGTKPVTAMVNGQVVGTIRGSGTIVAAAQKLAAAHGLKAFSIKVNGAKVGQPNAAKPLGGARTLEVFAGPA